MLSGYTGRIGVGNWGRMMHTILIADDDVTLSGVLAEVCRQDDYTVLIARTAEEAIRLSESTDIDLFLIDMMLPSKGGMELCNRLRSNPKTVDTAIIFLTGRDHYSIAESLDAGADDYVKKPFVVRELMARIRAHLRRVKMGSDENETLLCIDSGSGQVFVDDREVILTNTEFTLLQFLCREAQAWYTTQQLLSGVWNYPKGVGDSALVRNHIRNLRNKLETNPKCPSIIYSHHGRGYTIQARVKFLAF